MKPSTYVRVRCMVEIPVDKWDSKSTFESLLNIGRSEGKTKIQKIMKENGGRLIGEPQVICVIAEEEPSE